MHFNENRFKIHVREVSRFLYHFWGNLMSHFGRILPFVQQKNQSNKQIKKKSFADLQPPLEDLPSVNIFVVVVVLLFVMFVCLFLWFFFFFFLLLFLFSSFSLPYRIKLNTGIWIPQHPSASQVLLAIELPGNMISCPSNRSKQIQEI